MCKINQTAGIYVHIPFCESRCGYCSFVSGCDLSLAPQYLAALNKEAEERSDKYLSVDSIYIGGGTPSVLPGGSIKSIIEMLNKNFSIALNTEVTVEANPNSVTKDFINECKSCGVNRISLGLQSDNDRLLKEIGRKHTYDVFLKSLDVILAKDINNISADLILGLPSQSASGMVKTAGNIIKLPLKHISLYSLKIEEGTDFYNRGVETNEDTQAEMYSKCAEIFEKNGFLRYEVSNFAVNGYQSRHNGKYWNHTPYFGLGVAAHSFINNTRIENTSNIGLYLSGVNDIKSEQLSNDDLIGEYIMLSLRTANGIDLSFLRQKYGYDILSAKAAAIEELYKLNAIEVLKNNLKLTDEAFYIMNSVILKLI